MLLRDYIARAAEGLGKSQRQRAAKLGLTHMGWHRMMKGGMDPHLKTLIRFGKTLGFDVILSRPGESVAMRVAVPKTTESKAEIEIVAAPVSAWRQSLDDLTAHLTPEQFEQVARVLAAAVGAVAPAGAGKVTAKKLRGKRD